MMRSHQDLPIAITLGDPAGIGPDIFLKAMLAGEASSIVVITDPDVLAQRAQELKIDFNKIADRFSIHSVKLPSPCRAGKPDHHHAPYILETLQYAVKGCLENKFHALVTGPVNKALINTAGIPFTGHTQFLAQLTHTPHTVMMLMTDKLKVALLTDHIALAQVPGTITEELLTSSIRIIVEDLKNRFNLSHPRILICGLNPHAGENGYLGREEIEIIIPTLKKLHSSAFTLIGPVSADTAFTYDSQQQADIILAMYHDQGLPVLKAQGFGNAVNVTLGLPIIRTSVDHGTAYSLAGSGQADEGSFKAALALGKKLRK